MKQHGILKKIHVKHKVIYFMKKSTKAFHERTFINRKTGLSIWSLLMNSIKGNACLEKPLNHRIKQYFEGKFIVFIICKQSIHNALNALTICKIKFVCFNIQ